MCAGSVTLHRMYCDPRLLGYTPVMMADRLGAHTPATE
jgi:hypothetical protein